jgi:hypothetical protein
MIFTIKFVLLGRKKEGEGAVEVLPLAIETNHTLLFIINDTKPLYRHLLNQ